LFYGQIIIKEFDLALLDIINNHRYYKGSPEREKSFHHLTKMNTNNSLCLSTILKTKELINDGMVIKHEHFISSPGDTSTSSQEINLALSSLFFFNVRCPPLLTNPFFKIHQEASNLMGIFLYCKGRSVWLKWVRKRVIKMGGVVLVCFVICDLTYRPNGK